MNINENGAQSNWNIVDVKALVKSAIQKGDDLFERELFNEAASNYTEAIERLKTSRTSQFALSTRLLKSRALCYTKMAPSSLQTDELALTDTKLALEIDPKNVEVWMLRARLLEKVERILEAIEATQRVLEINLQHKEANAFLKEIITYELLKMRDSAPPNVGGELDFQKIIFCFMGEEEIGNNELNEMLIDLIRALFANHSQNEPQTVRLFNFFLAQVFVKLSNYLMSRSIIFLSLQLCNDSQIEEKTKLLRDLSTMYPIRSGERYKSRFIWVEQALQLQTDRESQTAIDLRIDACSVGCDKDIAEIVKELQECVAVCDQRNYVNAGKDARLRLVGALSEIGNYEDAIRYGNAFLEIDNFDNLRKTASAKTQIADAQMALGKYDDAIENFDLAFNIFPDPSALISLGLCYNLKAGKCLNQQNGDSPLEEQHLQTAKKYIFEGIALQQNKESLEIIAQIILAQIYIKLRSTCTDTGEPIVSFLESIKQRATQKSQIPEIRYVIRHIYSISALFWLEQKDYSKAKDDLLIADAADDKQLFQVKTEEGILTHYNKPGFVEIYQLIQLCNLMTKKYEEALLFEENQRLKYFNLFSPGTINNSQITIEGLKKKAVVKNSLIIIVDCIETITNFWLVCWIIYPFNNKSIKNIVLKMTNDHSQGLKLESTNNLFEFEKDSLISFRNVIDKELFRTFTPVKQESDSPTTLRSSELFSSLFEYIEQELTDNKCDSFVFVPAGDVYNARFASAKCQDGNTLIQKFTFSICPAVSLIADRECESSTATSDKGTSSHAVTDTNNNRVLIIGDPQYNLPYAFEEATFLKELFDSKSTWNTVPLTRSNARKEEILTRLEYCKLFHIAAHADLSTDDIKVLRGSILLEKSPQAGK